MLSTPTPIILGSETYRLAPFTKGLQDEYKQWLIGNARRALAEMKLPPQQYREQLAEISKQVASGTYNYLGETYMMSLASVEGQAYLFHLLMRDCNDGKDVSYEKCVELWLAYPAEFSNAFEDMFTWLMKLMGEQSKKKQVVPTIPSVELTGN